MNPPVLVALWPAGGLLPKKNVDIITSHGYIVVEGPRMNHHLDLRTVFSNLFLVNLGKVVPFGFATSTMNIHQ